MASIKDSAGNSTSEITIREATQEDVESLTTMIPRGWGTSGFMHILFKDGPPMRAWWTQVYTAAISDPKTYRIVVAVDSSSSQVVGLLTLALWRKSAAHPSASPGICSLAPLISDHDQMLHDALGEQVALRRKVMGEEANYMIDLFGVDGRYQRQGIGRRLMRVGCEVADEEGVAMFLDTATAREYYLGLGVGFEVKVRTSNEIGEGGNLVRYPKSGM